MKSHLVELLKHSHLLVVGKHFLRNVIASTYVCAFRKFWKSMSFLLLRYFMFHRTLYMCEPQPAQSKMVFKVRLRSLTAIVIAFKLWLLFVGILSIKKPYLIFKWSSLYIPHLPPGLIYYQHSFSMRHLIFFFSGCLWKTAKTLTVVNTPFCGNYS